MLVSAISSIENLNRFMTQINPIFTDEIKRLKKGLNLKKIKQYHMRF